MIWIIPTKFEVTFIRNKDDGMFVMAHSVTAALSKLSVKQGILTDCTASND